MKNGKRTCRRFFGGMLSAQERWLNRMAAEGWRLVRCGQASYEFEPSEPSAVQYAVEYVAHKSPQGVQDYKAFLEEMGCRVFYKNINWHYSVGKVKLRPWAEKGGRIAARRTTLDKELLIVEKRSNGKPFALHTTLEDRADLYREIAKPWLFFFGIFAGVGLLERMPALAVIGLLALAPALFYGLEAARLSWAAKTCEESWEALREQEAKGRWLRAAVFGAGRWGSVFAAEWDALLFRQPHRLGGAGGPDQLGGPLRLFRRPLRQKAPAGVGRPAPCGDRHRGGDAGPGPGGRAGEYALAGAGPAYRQL